MSEYLIALLGEEPSAPIHWSVWRDGGVSRLARCEDIGAFGRVAANAIAEGIAIAAVLPGDLAAYRSLPTPPKNQKKFKAAAALLLEDEIAEPVEEMHIAVGVRPDSNGGEGRVLAIKRSEVEAWVEAFTEIGAPLSYLTCDFLCLPGERDRPVVFALGDRLIAHDGRRGFSVEASLGGDLLSSMLKDSAADEDADDAAEDSDAAVVAKKPKMGIYTDPDQAAQRLTPGCDRLGEANERTLLALAGEAMASGAATNLLQGEFRPASTGGVQLGEWRRAAILAGAAIALSLVVSLADGRRTGALAAHYDAEAHRIHGEAFPTANVLDIRRHARAQLSKGGGVSFIDIARRIEIALGDNDGVSIDRIQFDAARGIFTFSLRSRSNEEIDRFRAALASAGVTASDSTGYRRQGDAWVGDMTARVQ